MSSRGCLLYLSPKANDEKTGMLALRSSCKRIYLGDGKINLVKFFEGYRQNCNFKC